VNLENNCIFRKIIICPENFLYIWKHFGNPPLYLTSHTPWDEVLATALIIYLLKTGEGLLHACISSNLMMNHGVAAVIRVHLLCVLILCPSARVRKQKTLKIWCFVICVEDYHKRTQPYTVSNFPTSVVTKTSPACLRPHLHATGTKSNRNENCNCQHDYMRLFQFSPLARQFSLLDGFC
jgi:hypothetical protein